MSSKYYGLIREAFRAGFMAAPDPDTDVFTWKFDGWNIAAADKEQSAWDAYVRLNLNEPVEEQPESRVDDLR